MISKTGKQVKIPDDIGGFDDVPSEEWPPRWLKERHPEMFQAATAPKNGSSHLPAQPGGIIWNPRPISAMKGTAPGDYVMEGVTAPGKITLLSAEAKGGKTTFMCLLFKMREKGGVYCGAKVKPGPVVVISEEPEANWEFYRDLYGLKDHVQVIPLPFLGKPSEEQWERLIRQGVKALDSFKGGPAPLVVFDTLSHLWPLEDENANAAEAKVLMPLRQISEAGAALVLVHHFGSEKSGPRGGTELRGFPDLIADLHLAKPGDFLHPQRILRVRGRLQTAPSEVKIELKESGYIVVEGGIQAGTPGLWQILLSLLPAESPGLSAKEIRQKWPTKPAPPAKTLMNLLAAKWEEAGLSRSGTGKKNDPKRYWKMIPPAKEPSQEEST
jgi:hypothetical protein